MVSGEAVGGCCCAARLTPSLKKNPGKRRAETMVTMNKPVTTILPDAFIYNALSAKSRGLLYTKEIMAITPETQTKAKSLFSRKKACLRSCGTTDCRNCYRDRHQPKSVLAIDNV